MESISLKNNVRFSAKSWSYAFCNLHFYQRSPKIINWARPSKVCIACRNKVVWSWKLFWIKEKMLMVLLDLTVHQSEKSSWKFAPVSQEKETHHWCYPSSIRNMRHIHCLDSRWGKKNIFSKCYRSFAKEKLSPQD